MSALPVLAYGVMADNNFGDTESGGMAGPMGLFLIVLLIIATVLLIRNMNARIRRLPERFPDAREADHNARETDDNAREATDQEANSG